jgi:hypothetical protein
MLILHAAFYENRLFVWGEIPAAPEPRVNRVSKGRLKASKPPPFPHDAGKDHLSKALQEAGLGQLLNGLASETAVAWLPTHKNRPLASSPLISESSASREPVAISPWQVTTLALSPPAEVELLCACVNQEVLAPGVIIGKDLRFWATALRFAGSLAARQRFLPGLTEIRGTYYARWEPVVSGNDSGVATRLAAIMPRGCRALTPDTASPPVRPAEIARMEGVKNLSAVRGMIIRVSDQLRCGEISLFEKDPEEAEASKARLEAKRAKRRESHAKNKGQINARRREDYALKSLRNKD